MRSSLFSQTANMCRLQATNDSGIAWDWWSLGGRRRRDDHHEYRPTAASGQAYRASPGCCTADAKLQNLLSRGGRLYLVAIHQNNTKDISARMLSLGLQSKVCYHLRQVLKLIDLFKEIIKRRAGRELLSVLRISKPI